MPLVRAKIRNEYGLGLPELYKEADKEDPKAVLGGVSVAGLVGILRQLGDLAEFAAEIFNNLQGQVMITASRSRKLKDRVERIETAFPPVEKAVLAQTSHLHFCYTAGSRWHGRVKNKSNHFIYDDLPPFIMDSYEECSEPPRLHLLDRFDPGGPGSCLKRYSDPTFFKAVSGSFSGENGVQKDKKARKIKRKRSGRRHREASHRASLSNYTGRRQFIAPNGCEHKSPTRTPSTVGMTFKSDPGDQSHSFDSRTGTKYTECIFNSNSPKSIDREPREITFSGSEVQHYNTLDSSCPVEETRIEDSDFPHSLPQEQTASSSFSVTWDEKAEIIEPQGNKPCNSDETPEMLLTDPCLVMPENKATPIGHADDVEKPLELIPAFNELDEIENETKSVPLDVDRSPTLVSVWNRHDEIDSEPEGYLDALNSIDSESENDRGLPTKLELGQNLSHFNELESEGEGQGAGDSDPDPSDIDASSVVSNKLTPSDEADGRGTDGFPAHELSPQNAGPDSSMGIDSCRNGDIVNDSIPSSVSDKKLPVSVAPGLQSDKDARNVQKSGESSTYISTTGQSAAFWTNGGLFGLQPSKPPNPCLPSSASEDSSTRCHDEAPCSSHCMVSDSTYRENDTSIEDKFSNTEPANSDAKDGESTDSHNCIQFKDVHGHYGSGEENATEAGIDQPALIDLSRTCDKANQEKKENSWWAFRFGRKFGLNGFQTKVPLVNGDTSELSGHVKADSFAQMSKTALTDKLGSGSPSSPPLEHMKISSYPVSEFETSKLKLQFPVGKHRDENNKYDTFPSFNLVLEPSALSHDDDDSFCRSPSRPSNECLSFPSGSDSESESREIPGSSIPELDDGRSSHFGPSLDLPCFDAVNPSVQFEPISACTTNGFLKLECPKDPVPSPPPLEEDKQALVSGSLTHEAITSTPQEQHAQQRLDGDKEPKLTADGKGMVGRGDFLPQIRTKAVGSDDGEDCKWDDP